MRLVSPYTVLGFVVVWTVVILVASRQFLFNAHQAWFQQEEEKMVQELSIKLDNLDTRDTRQLNQLYAEIRRVEDISQKILNCMRFDNCSSSKRRERSIVSNVAAEVSTVTDIEPSIAVLVIACNRENYIRRTLDSLLKYRPSAGLFPIIVSQDCNHSPTAKVISSYGNRVTCIKQPDQSNIVITKEKKDIKNLKALQGYYKISRHYRWALNQVFDEMGYTYTLIVEDDLEVAPDFFSYFSSLRHLLEIDSSVWCISAWNDNGKPDNVDPHANSKLYRSDFFPGLGWMLTRNLWHELQPKWPEKYWDDWMREPEQRKDRVCIRPEISRTITFGGKGVSAGQFYKQHLQYIKLNSEAVDFSKHDLSQLKEAEYDSHFLDHVLDLPSLSVSEVVANMKLEINEVQIPYSTRKEYETNAKRLKIMFDFRGGVPRTGYKGVVSLMYKGRRVHLTPPQPWRGYSSLS